MKYACILLLLAGCVWGHKEVKQIQEVPPPAPDSSLAVLEKKIDALQKKISNRLTRTIPARHDSVGVIDWPDDSPYKFIFFYRSVDTNGNEMSDPEIRFQLEQFNADTSLGYIDLKDRSDRSESDYWIQHDTMYVNVPYLRWFNPSPTGEYLYQWRFRARLEDFFDERKNSGWVYGRKVLNLIRVDRWVGVPQRPVLIEVH
jgi:hypothetical protein